MVKHKKLNVVKLFLILFFVITVIAPLISMLFHISQIDIMAFVASQQFKTGLLNSLLLATCATVISIFLAMLLSFATERSNIKFKNMWCIIFTLPMLIPSISNGMGLILLLGSNGVLTNLFNLDFNVYGFQGVLIGSVMYSFPVAFLMFQDMLRYEDYTPYEAAKVLGIPRKNQILSIFLPYMKKPLISVFFVVFTMVITDYGVPLMVGGKFNTLPVLMYNEVIGLLNFGKGGAIGVVLLVPAVIAFLIDIFNKDNSIQDFITKKARIAKNKLRDILSYILCTVTSIVVVLPIAMFCFLSFIKKYPTDISFSLSNIFKAFNMNAGQFLLNALIIAASVSIIGTAFSYITAYITARVPGKRSKTLHLFSITSMAIPGLVLGLSFAIFFKGSFIYGTLAILILVNLIHFFSSPYLLAYNSFNKINNNLEAVGRTLGVSRFYMLKDVLIPQMYETIIEMFTYFFVNCMMTISAVSFLYTVSTMPLSLMITQFEAQRLLECSAFVSLVILVINLSVKGLAALTKTVIKKRYV